MANLNPTAASLLGFLHGGEYSGYELLKVAEELIGDFWSLTQSQVYRELAALAARGLVEVGDVGARSRRPYRITDEGRAEFAAWLCIPPADEQIRFPLLLTLAFGEGLDRERLLSYIDDHRHRHQQRLRKYQEIQETLPLTPYQKATLSFGLRYERAVLDWTDELPGLLPP
jgi:DNA-binding PadR family transcriptional regulator